MNDENAIKPEGLTDREWELVRADRAQQAEEARRVAAWAPVIEELNEAGEGEDDEEAWDPTAALFIERAGAHGWRLDQEIEDFVGALMRATGCKRVQIKNHGWVWKKLP